MQFKLNRVQYAINYLNVEVFHSKRFLIMKIVLLQTLVNDNRQYRFVRFGERNLFWNLAEKDLALVKMYSSNNAWLPLKSRVVLVVAPRVHIRRECHPVAHPSTQNPSISINSQGSNSRLSLFRTSTFCVPLYQVYMCVCVCTLLFLSGERSSTTEEY